MKIIADLHTHSMVSQHAYSTLDELCAAAKAKSFQAIALTDHGPEMPDGAMAHHFYCLGGLPDRLDGVDFYRGAETNIMDFDGCLDLSEKFLSRLDFVIASYHIECIAPGTSAQNTHGFLRAIENPYVNCLGHCGNPVYPIDQEAVVKACAAAGKLIEINSASFSVRPGSEQTCRRIAELCAEHKVRIIVSSDAHSKWQVGEHTAALQMLSEIHFPEELVLNADGDRLRCYFHRIGK